MNLSQDKGSNNVTGGGSTLSKLQESTKFLNSASTKLQKAATLLLSRGSKRTQSIKNYGSSNIGSGIITKSAILYPIDN